MASKRPPLHPVHPLLAPSDHHHPGELVNSLPLSVRAKANTTNHQARISQWSIHDERGDVDGRDIFVHESFNLGDFRTPAGNIGGGGSEDRNGRDQ